ncbi:MAG TPA: sigma-70 family RNA polymerase sigma factor [Verrucomicrobiae bacterium]|nr:sigma-70 family RNA polymerase sigma factor [Verrucomicrobiae bacterium]
MHDPEEDSRGDADLIALVNQGDLEAFTVLYRRHCDWVANLAARFTGDHALALDVLQETFLYFLRKFPGFTLTCQLRSFLYPAVRNLALAARRKAARNQSDDGHVPDMPAPVPVAGGPGTLEDSREQLRLVLANLPPAQREVLLLRFVDGLSLQEIADALEIPLGTVKSRLHHALETLRQDERTKQFYQE